MVNLDFKNAEDFEDGVVIREVKNFELSHIFDCGQCFRWGRQEDGSYIGVAFGKVIEVRKVENDVYIYNGTLDDFNSTWLDYFDLSRDYSSIKDKLSSDPLLKDAVEFGHGIRLLQQDPFELLVSFIISANNRIPMIKRAIDNISRLYGNKLEYKDKVYYAFPTVEQLQDATEEELEGCGTGFRAKYIKDSVEKVFTNEFNLDYIKEQNDDKCHEELQKFTGVGPKVADCIMLFSMCKYSAFPVDVWVKRAMINFYVAPDVSLKKIRDFGREKFGELSGFAQQYLFYFARENKIEV